jgi:hypothetical protein
VITGLLNGTQYRFRVQAVNAVGTSGFSTVTNPVTPGGPDAPTIGTAIAEDGAATLSWTAPAYEGLSPITGYAVTPYIGFFPLAPISFASTDTTQVVGGLTNGTTYRFAVAATNAFGTGSQSAVSNPVTPSVARERRGDRVVAGADIRWRPADHRLRGDALHRVQGAAVDDLHVHRDDPGRHGSDERHPVPLPRAGRERHRHE